MKELYQINTEIRDKEVRVISNEGAMLGVMSSREALQLAEDAELDLVKIAPSSDPPVCKIMDYGKFKYEQGKKEKENKKNQKIVEVKEIWLSMTIDVGDLNVKANKTKEILDDGNKVKVGIKMKGRQNAHAALGFEVMDKFFSLLDGKAIMDKKPLAEGKNIIMVLSPAK